MLPAFDILLIRLPFPIGRQLVDGENEIVFSLEGCDPLVSQLFVWPENAKVVVSDIEGVISVTKSVGGVLGFFASRSAVHEGVTHLLKSIRSNGYQILYIATKSLQRTTSTKVAHFVYTLMHTLICNSMSYSLTSSARSPPQLHAPIPDAGPSGEGRSWR